jgi:hypothetical protein
MVRFGQVGERLRFGNACIGMASSLESFCMVENAEHSTFPMLGYFSLRDLNFGGIELRKKNLASAAIAKSKANSSLILRVTLLSALGRQP